jgi:hypothetical protein
VSIEAISLNNQQNDMVFRTGATTMTGFGTERMRIDTSGNVGIGVTPNSWTSGWTALQFGSYGNLSALSNQINLSSNIYYSGSSWYYKNTNPATNFYQQNGGFGWQSAASGTAGTSPSLTTYMWLSAAGNLGIGTTSPASISGKTIDISNSSDVALYLHGGSTSGASGGFSIKQSSAQDTFVWNYSNSYMAFATNNTERMRFTSDGNLLVGATSNPNSGKINIDFNGGAVNGIVYNDTASANGTVFAYFTVSGTACGQINRIATTNAVTYASASDRRLKSNIQPITAEQSGSIIDSLKPCSFTWNSNNSEDVGFVGIHPEFDLLKLFNIEYNTRVSKQKTINIEKLKNCGSINIEQYPLNEPTNYGPLFFTNKDIISK